MLFLGLLITMPLILFGSALLMKLMERFPVFVTIGAALIGYVAGEMVIGDPAVKTTSRPIRIPARATSSRRSSER